MSKCLNIEIINFPNFLLHFLTIFVTSHYNIKRNIYHMSQFTKGLIITLTFVQIILHCTHQSIEVH